MSNKPNDKNGQVTLQVSITTEKNENLDTQLTRNQGGECYKFYFRVFSNFTFRIITFIKSFQ